MLNTSSVYCM